MSKKITAVLAVLVLVLAGVGGWLLHAALEKKNYEKAWTGYTKEVEIWRDVDERYRVLEPMCGELAGKSECEKLTTAGKEANEKAKGLPLNMKKASEASKSETEKLEKATGEIKVEREKLETAVVKVEKAAETSIADKFAPVLKDAEKKATEANKSAASWKGKVKDENALGALTKAAGELSTACEKWKGKDTPTGQEGVQGYIELKRLMVAVDDAFAKAKASHDQWQKEEDERKAAEMRNKVKAFQGQYLGGYTRSTNNILTVKSDGTAIYKAVEPGSSAAYDKCLQESDMATCAQFMPEDNVINFPLTFTSITPVSGGYQVTFAESFRYQSEYYKGVGGAGQPFLICTARKNMTSGEGGSPGLSGFKPLSDGGC